MLPLTLLKTAQSSPMLVELKNGDTYNGVLDSCDSWMNIKLLDVIWTSRDGDKFWKIPEVYVRGNSIKYMTIPDEVLEQVAADEDSARERRMAMRGRGRGRGSTFQGRSDRGRGRGERGRGYGGRRGGRGGFSGRGRGEGRGRGSEGRGRGGDGRGRGVAQA